MFYGPRVGKTSKYKKKVTPNTPHVPLNKVSDSNVHELE